MKVLKCKICQEEVGVPENRASIICVSCAENEQVRKDLEGAIENQKMKIENCNEPITRRKLINTLETLYMLHDWRGPMPKDIRAIAEGLAGDFHGKVSLQLFRPC